MKFVKLNALVALAMLALSGALSAQNWPEQTNAKWDEMLLAGQLEGSLVIGGGPELSGAFTKQFEADTGIDLLLVTGPSREIRARFSREIEAGSPTIDLIFDGPNNFGLLESDGLMAIRPILVLPEVTNTENWRQGKIPFIDDADLYLPVPSYYLSGRVLVNANLADTETILTWDDLLRPEFKGKIISEFSPAFGGGLTLSAYLMQQKGPEFVKALYIGQEVVLTRKYRDVTDGVARGTYTIGLSAVPRDIVRYQSEGIDNLRVLEMADVEGYVVGGHAVLTVAANAPNPNASAVFANWFLSQMGQEAYSAAFNVPSERLDVADGPWPKSIEPLAGVDYHDSYDQGWRLIERRPLQDAAIAIIVQ